MASVRILVTGVTGFAGGWLAEALLARGGTQVFGLARRASWTPVWHHLQPHVELHGCDLTDRDDLERVLRHIEPDQVYHLAGYPHVGRSFQEPDAAWASNLQATLGLYDAVARLEKRPRILAVGSGLIYGDPHGEAPFTEDSPLLPTNPYSASKAAADLAGYQYTRSHGLEIVRVRPFNHIGPRQAEEFAVPHFAQQLAEILRGRREPVLETGDLRPRRDLTDVRDTVQAYLLLMAKGRGGEAYNVGTGVSHSMREVLDQLVALAAMPVEVVCEPSLMRTTDTPAIRVDASKLRAETGWQPRFSLAETLRDTLDYWKKELDGAAAS